MAMLPSAPDYRGTRVSLGPLWANYPKDTGLPWHRVVNASRKIAPRGSGRMGEQKRRLRAEGIVFNGDTVAKEFYWE